MQRLHKNKKIGIVLAISLLVGTAAAVAALTVYDMVKSAGKGVEIGPIRLLEKSGGKSGTWKRKVRSLGPR